MSKMKVYLFEHCYCIYESSSETISVHATKKGAYEAMRKHKVEDFVKDRENAITMGMVFGSRNYQNDQLWNIKEMELLE